MGHVLTAVNGIPVTGKQLDDGRDALQIIDNQENYPLRLKFSRPRMTTNEKIFLASMFYPLFAIASQLSPEPKSSGIEVLEADTFKLHCFQTLTGRPTLGLISKFVINPLSRLYLFILSHHVWRCSCTQIFCSWSSLLVQTLIDKELYSQNRCIGLTREKVAYGTKTQLEIKITTEYVRLFSTQLRDREMYFSIYTKLFIDNFQ